MASTHINHLKDYYERVDRFRKRKNALSIGDSWFQYPLRFYPDLQTRLSSNKLFGERVNFLDDSYPGRDAKDVPRMIRSWREIAAVLASRGRPFDLILLSLGGNDVIGKDFGRHLTDGSGRDGSKWAWNDKVPAVVRRWIDLGELAATFDSVAASYDLIVAMRDEFAPAATIIGHTYAAVTPMDKSYKFFKLRAGPWIWKPATKQGISLKDQQTIVDWLLESFHALLLSVADRAGGFVVLDTRRELTDPTGWDNEIHPLGEGFVHLADTFWKPAVEQALAKRLLKIPGPEKSCHPERGRSPKPAPAKAGEGSACRRQPQQQIPPPATRAFGMTGGVYRFAVERRTAAGHAHAMAGDFERTLRHRFGAQAGLQAPSAG